MKTKGSAMRPFLYAVLFLILFLFEFVFTPIRILGIRPQYLLCGVVCLALCENEKYAALFGLIFGLLADFAGGAEWFGITPIFFVLISYIVGYLKYRFWRCSLWNSLIAVSISVFVRDIVTMLVLLLRYDTQTIHIPGALLKIVLPKLLMTVVADVILYFIIKKISVNKKWRRYDEIYY